MLDIFDPVINFMLKPLKRLVNWFHNRYLADKTPAVKPLLKPITPRPTEMVLYIPM